MFYKGYLEKKWIRFLNDLFKYIFGGDGFE